ncbi:MAG: flavodoxin-dependent (E)-4-hydroxy-3-methylbut-2-enyl-diphosphate synthase [Candidatus Cloacimonetes bacterium]|nr:flavodoxin-dependent (E)-4-hydroxy-3-methylbut-2-enyl-diphosphate synthase [Candidatus Cloacimonadota bacterium]
MEIKRRTTRRIMIGNVAIGGGAPVSIQSMLVTRTADIVASMAQINALHQAGCELIRIAIADEQDAQAVEALKRQSPLPLIADIHFDHKLALTAIAGGIDALRINPGNIGSEANVREIVAAVRERMIPIRIGVNSGSIHPDLLRRYGLSAGAMVESALQHVHILERLSYHEIKISVKASHLGLTLDSYRLLSQRCDYPLHLGLTEAGTEFKGMIKSSIALGILLSEGIGDTIRVSLTAEPEREIAVAQALLQTLGLRRGLDIISCPTCGRTRINLITLTQQVEDALKHLADMPLTVAVMGCAVNGPGEAREADYGIAGGEGEGLLFAKGRIVGKYPEQVLVRELVKLIEEHSGDRS